MLFTRRAFLGATSAASALLGSTAVAKPASSIHDPLGVRADFPGVEKTIYFDSAYTTLSPRQAVGAAQAFLGAIGHNPPDVPEMMHESEAVRERFARLIGAAQEDWLALCDQ